MEVMEYIKKTFPGVYKVAVENCGKEEKPKRKKKPEEVKHRYGKFKHVMLTDIEYERLKDKLDDREKWIEKLDRYIESKGASYKNHSVTMQNWYRNEQEERARKAPDAFRPHVAKTIYD